MQAPSELYKKVEQLQNLLVALATGGGGDDATYKTLRRELLAEPSIADLIPDFVKSCRDLDHFWQYIKSAYAHYAERRLFLWSQFSPLLEALEANQGVPADDIVSTRVTTVNSATIHSLWAKALERRSRDPEGAITAARTLLESVCKHILDESGNTYPDDSDLPKLYRLAAEQLKIAPSQHSEHVFKQILGGCTSVVEGLGALRNRLGDSHGVGKKAVRPAPRHAELAVNLTGTMATFLIATWEVRQQQSTSDAPVNSPVE